MERNVKSPWNVEDANDERAVLKECLLIFYDALETQWKAHMNHRN